MQCSEKLQLNNLDLQTLQNLPVIAPDKNVYKEAKKHFDNVAKPLDGLGDLEDIVARIASVKGKTDVSVSKRALVIMSADNGIVEEGVTQSEKDVTLKVIKNILKGKSSAAVMAKNINADCFTFDVGIDTDEKLEGLIDKKIRYGSRNFLKEKAMTKEEVLKAINLGIETAYELKEKGYELLVLGEMGIGNTTTSSAICASLLKLDAKEVTGRGAGLSDAGLDRKINVINEAVWKYDLYNADALTVLESVGGYDIAALAGVCIGGAIYGIPVVLDGVITQAAALVAVRIVPGVKDYLFASHKGREKASSLILNELGLHPVIDARLALGEGTGGLMFVSLLDNALCVYSDAARFEELKMEEYKRNL